MLAAGAVGEFGPLLVITLVLSSQGTLHNALILLAFIAIAVVLAVASGRSARFTIPLFERTLESSSQLAVRWILVLIFALVLIAYHLGLDLLLGGFAAGLITRHMLGTREARVFESKLTAIAFGAFVPFFFVVSGMNLDLPALFSSVGSVAKMGLFFVLFLVVRGKSALLLYRGVLGRTDRLALALMSSTQLPLGARDHDAGDCRRSHAGVDRGGADRWRGALDAVLSRDRLAAAWRHRGGRSRVRGGCARIGGRRSRARDADGGGLTATRAPGRNAQSVRRAFGR